ncbi:MAG: HAD family hydrolase [Chloroflexi bacterium]|nr:HAD family hydrolase [Chloroflexota bacterium]
MQPYLLLDAGWTVLFPDYRIIRQVIQQNGYDIPEERLERLMAEFIRDYDERLKNNSQADFDLFEWILTRAGVDRQVIPAVISQLLARDAEKSLWTYTYPWVHEALARLARQGYRMSVISNADGHVAQELDCVGLAPYFEEIFDSHLVGYAKPDPRLFEHALTKLGLHPEECLFVGDVYYVDVLGANQVGMAALHLDRYGLYEGWPGYRIPTIAALPDFLAQNPDLRDEGFFPLRREKAETVGLSG